jgi:mannosyltransferase OCH1-like enzyme
MYPILIILFIILSIILIVTYYTYHTLHDRDDNTNNPNNNFISSYPSIPYKPYKQKIPLKIHQTYFRNNMDIQYYETCMINRYMNMEYEYYFYNNDDVDRYVRTYYPQYFDLFNKIIPGAYKADLFRYLVLYREGGVYLDCKSSTIVPLREFIPKDVGFVTFLDRPVGTLQISFLASVPFHPVLKRCIEIAFHNIKNKLYGDSPLDITGPKVCGRAFNQLINSDKEEIDIGYYSKINSLIIGKMKVDKNDYEILEDNSGKPLVSKGCCLYYKNTSNRSRDKTHYDTAWNSRMNVFKND